MSHDQPHHITTTGALNFSSHSTIATLHIIGVYNNLIGPAHVYYWHILSLKSISIIGRGEFQGASNLWQDDVIAWSPPNTQQVWPWPYHIHKYDSTSEYACRVGMVVFTTQYGRTTFKLLAASWF